MRLLTILLRSLLANLTAQAPAVCCVNGIHWANFR